MKKIGLLAGVGRLPVECAKAAAALGYEVYAVGLIPGVDPELKECTADYTEISVAKLQTIIDYMKAKEVTEITLLGKVTKELLYSGDHAAPDMRMLALMFTKREPTPQEQQDMEFGMKMAREIGRLDVGQTVVVKQQAVMALEAIEGTDACIRRGGELARGGAVVAKTAKPNQDLRFDVPAVGMKTMEIMVEVGASALVIEAGRTLLVEKDKVIALAEAHDITIVAME